jgi:hypothetical protein
MTVSNRPPVIGSYKKPPAPAAVEAEEDLEIVDKRPKADTPASSLSEGIQEELKDSIDRTKKTAEKAKSYEEILSERDISLQKAHAIVDAMLERGFYEETMSVTRSSTVTFRTRVHADYVRYLRALELYNPKYVEEQQEIQIRYFLAASIVSFKGHSFNKAKDASDDEFFDTKLDWLSNQPESLVRLLATKLSKFDQQIQIVMSEGVVENF